MHHDGMILGRRQPRPDPSPDDADATWLGQEGVEVAVHNVEEAFAHMRAWAAAGYGWEHVRHELAEVVGVPLPSEAEIRGIENATADATEDGTPR